MANDDFRAYKTEYELESALIFMGKAKNRTEARKLIYGRLIPLEKHYQKKILALLERAYPTGRWWKNAAGIGQASGEPDIYGILDGQFYAIEVKRPLVGRATPLQKRAIREIRAAGGCAMLGTYADEVMDAIRIFRTQDLRMGPCSEWRYHEALTGGLAAVCVEGETDEET